jgi:6-pyruvoyl tetrahydropterin synthase/QueD family protein
MPTTCHGAVSTRIVQQSVGSYTIPMPLKLVEQEHPNNITSLSRRLIERDRSEMDSVPKHVTISKEIEFDAGHRIPNHKSKCRNPHGHRYRVVAYCEGQIVTEPGAPDEGMLIDYGDLKSIMISKIHDPLDHGFIVWHDDKDLLDAFMWWDPAALPNPEKVVTAGMDPVWKIIRFPYIPTA